MQMRGTTVECNSVCPLYGLLQIEAKRRPLRTLLIKSFQFAKSWEFIKGAARCSTPTGGGARMIYVFLIITTNEGLHAMYVDLPLCPLDMFLYTTEVRFTQIFESQLLLSQNLENGTFGRKIRTFLLSAAET